MRIPDHEILHGVEEKALELIKTPAFREALASIDILSFQKAPKEYKEHEGLR